MNDERAAPVSSGGHAIQLSRDGAVAILTFDVPGHAVNTFTEATKKEFAEVLSALERDTTIEGAVLVSGKKDSFIAGADIEEILEWTGFGDAETAAREGQAMLDRLEQLRVPIVAAIHGVCLGGGLEAVLACAHRIATDHPKTQLALPEVQLGLIPGAGGTQRLPRLVGLRAALDMILTGRKVRSRKALKMGLVHELVHPAILLDVAIQRAREIAAGKRRRNAPARKKGLVDLALDGNPLGRALVFNKARTATLAKSRGHYPAPLAALEVVAEGYRNRERGFVEEARRFAQLSTTPECRELIFLFFATTALKKDPGIEQSVQTAARVGKIGVLGAGFMGAGIAAVAAQRGFIVRLKDASLERVGKGMAAIHGVLRERFVKLQITRQEFTDQMLRVGGTDSYTGFGNADLIIEAVFEDLAVKHDVVRQIERAVPATAIVASNTSTIPIARIAEGSGRPERVVGMHFFSPVHKMPLLEVIVTPSTLPDVVATVVAFGQQLGKTVVVVQDAPGFFVNRILAPYLNEAGRLLEGGAGIAEVDDAMVRFGFPVGPITLLDEVGLDIAGKSGKILHEAFGARFAPSAAVAAVILAGRLGRKERRGFYLYDQAGKKGGADESVYAEFGHNGARRPVSGDEVQRRCILSMINEAARCLEEGIISSPRDGDVAAVFGFGFPPFRGGPFRYVDAVGAVRLVAELEELNARFPGRFDPAPLLLDIAARHARFYPAKGRPV